MARIALAVGGAILGALLAPFTGGLINPYTGAEIGMAVGGILGGVLFPGKLPPGPRLNDLIVAVSTDGAPIPFGYGQVRVAGNIIWAPPIIESTQTHSVKGGPRQTTYTYTGNFAVAFGEGPVSFGRIWFDSKVVYDPTNGSASITGISETATSITVQSTLNPAVNTQVTLAGVGHGYDGKYKCIESTPTAFILFSNTTGLPTLGAGGTCSFPPPTYPKPTFYTGTETQGPDPTIQSFQGAANTPAFRGLAVAVFAGFPLNDFGNRVPNIRAEITYLLAQTPSSGLGVPDGSFSMSGTSPTHTAFGPITPSAAGDVAIVVTQFGGAALASNGYVQLDPGQVHLGSGGVFIASLPTGATINIDGGDPGSGNQCAVAMGLFQSLNTVLTGSITSIQCTSNIVTVTCNNSFLPGTWVGFSGVTAFSPSLNGNNYQILTANANQFTFALTAANQGPFSQTATATWQMYYQVVQQYINSPGGVVDVPFSVTLPQPARAGSYIVVTFAGTQFTSNFVTLDSLGDSNSNSYTRIDSPNPTIIESVMLAYALNSTAGSVTVTGTLRKVFFAQTLNVYEFPGGGSNGTPIVPTLPEIVTDLCERSGLASTQINTTQIGSVPTPGGYVVTRPSTGQACLKPLTDGFFFDGVESGGQLVFVPRGGSTQALTIPETDLGLYKDNYKIQEGFSEIQNLPRNIQITFMDKRLDYQQNHTQKSRNTRIVKTRNQSIYELPFQIDSTTARQIAEKALFLAYLERHTYDFNCWKALYMLFDPSDVIQFTYEGVNYIGRIAKTTIGTDFTLQLSVINENSSNYTSVIGGSSGTGVKPASGKTLPDTILFLFDIPLLRDTDANSTGGSGYYFALGSLDPTHWPGGVLEKSVDNSNWTQEALGTAAVSYGYATTVLGAPRSPWSWDTQNSLTIFMINGTLAGTSLLNVLNGFNSLIVGGEVCQFANAIQNPDGSFTVSMLTRGRRGTEAFCNTHGQNELVVFLNNPGVVRNQVTTADLQVQRFYEGLTYGQTPGSVSSTAFTNSGNDLRPYAVTSVAGSRDSGGNLTVTWIRRTRISGDWLEGTGTVPVSEAAESYDVDVLSGGSVIRTFAGLSSPTVAYTTAQQITDFGSKQANIALNIYQNSAAIGRGFVKSVTV